MTKSGSIAITEIQTSIDTLGTDTTNTGRMTKLKYLSKVILSKIAQLDTQI